MKKFYLVGFWKLNAGPQNVNRALIENSDGSMDYLKSENRYLRRLENIFKCIIYPTIVFSAYAPKLEFFIAKFLHKRIIILSHGCVKIENRINMLGLTTKQVLREKIIFRSADVIVAVSQIHAFQLSNVYPEFKFKIKYVNNGIDITDLFVRHIKHSNDYIIAVSGGNRQIKRNKAVCEAIQKLIDEGMNIHLRAYGRYNKSGENLYIYPFIQHMGQLEKTEYYDSLKNVDLYVINSESESFGLVVGDAINCGCSLLISKNVGAACIFEHLEEFDVIQNIWDVNEIAAKIQYLLLNSNAERLYSSIDRNLCSNKSAFFNLKAICTNE